MRVKRHSHRRLGASSLFWLATAVAATFLLYQLIATFVEELLRRIDEFK